MSGLVEISVVCLLPVVNRDNFERAVFYMGPEVIMIQDSVLGIWMHLENFVEDNVPIILFFNTVQFKDVAQDLGHFLFEVQYI